MAGHDKNVSHVTRQPIHRPRSPSASLTAEAARLLRKCGRHVDFRAVRAAGPGGQNVNKVATAVQLRFDVAKCSALAPSVSSRLLRLGGKRVTAGGVLLIQSEAHRTQLENRKQAMRELTEMLARSLPPPRARVPTHPTKAAREQRLRSKKQRSRLKRVRSGTDPE
jgi:ribosome-associated protein